MRAHFFACLVLAAPVLCSCAGTYQRPVGWAQPAQPPLTLPDADGPAEASPGLPSPPPTGLPAPAGRIEPIPAPSGPLTTSVWPPPAPVGGSIAVAVGSTGLSAEVTDIARPRAWTLIVVHHSASKVGGAALFDQWHKAKGWDGVGYDFVIGNGTDTTDGTIETTFRWREQREGAHVKGWNEMAVGICLVGNFEETDPTPAQMDSLRTLVRHLRGRFHIPRERVVGHGQLNATACPGKRLSVRAVADATDPDPVVGRGP